MNFLKSIRDTIATTKDNEHFNVAFFEPENNEEKKKISTYLCILAKKGEIVRVSDGLYMRPVTGVRKRQSQYKKNPPIQDKLGDKIFKRSKPKGVLIELTKTSLLELIANDSISFHVGFRCSQVQRNFKGQVVSLQLDSVSITVDDPIEMIEGNKKIRVEEEEESEE